jgi:hypothetical protein
MRRPVRLRNVRTALPWLFGAALVAQDSPTSRPDSQPAASRPAVAPIELRISPLVEMHYHMRAIAARDELPTKFEGMDRALAVVKKLDAELKSYVMWSQVEAFLAQARSAAELAAIAEQLPLESKTIGGTVLRPRATVGLLATGLQAIEAGWLERYWPARRAELEAARDVLAGTLRQHGVAAMQHLCRALELRYPSQPIPVFLALEMPPPGGVTHRLRERGVCFVGVRAHAGTQLLEVVLHESLHALDLLAENRDSAFQKMRSRMRTLGYAESDPEYRDLVHTLFFISAGDAVRAIVDPRHEDYGQVTGYYERIANLVATERTLWRHRMAGRLDVEQAISLILASVPRK